MFKSTKCAAVLAGIPFALASTANAATTDVDLMFVIDHSGSMADEYNTLADNISNVLTGISDADVIGSVGAGLLSFTGSLDLVQSITTDAADLKSDLQSEALSVGGSTEAGLGAMASVLPGGSLFEQVGWREGTVRSIVLITDEDNDFGLGFASDGYSAFESLIDSTGYLNNVIVSSFGTVCSELGGFATNQGCEYIQTSRPGGNAAFDLIQFVSDEEAFFTNFIDTKIDEIIDVIDNNDPTTPIPLPAAGWLLIAGLGGLGIVRRKRS